MHDHAARDLPLLLRRQVGRDASALRELLDARSSFCAEAPSIGDDGVARWCALHADAELDDALRGAQLVDADREHEQRVAVDDLVEGDVVDVLDVALDVLVDLLPLGVHEEARRGLSRSSVSALRCTCLTSAKTWLVVKMPVLKKCGAAVAASPRAADARERCSSAFSIMGPASTAFIASSDHSSGFGLPPPPRPARSRAVAGRRGE